MFECTTSVFFMASLLKCAYSWKEKQFSILSAVEHKLSCLHRFGNQAVLMGKWKSSLLLPWVGSHVLASLCAFAGRLYLLRTGAGSCSAAAFTEQVRVGGPWLLAQSPKFSRGPHLCPRTSSATWHLSLDESGPFFVRRRTRLPATTHSACC